MSESDEDYALMSGVEAGARVATDVETTVALCTRLIARRDSGALLHVLNSEHFDVEEEYCTMLLAQAIMENAADCARIMFEDGRAEVVELLIERAPPSELFLPKSSKSNLFHVAVVHRDSEALEIALRYVQTSGWSPAFHAADSTYNWRGVLRSSSGACPPKMEEMLEGLAAE